MNTTVKALLIKDIFGFATIQDIGRYGYRSLGIPVSGALDKTSCALSNLILGNDVYEAVIELYGSAELVVLNTTLISITGGVRRVYIDGVEANAWEPVLVEKNAVVSIRPERSPLMYVATYGGVKCDAVLGSRSTYLRGGIGCIVKTLEPGSVIESNTLPDSSRVRDVLSKGSFIDIYEKHVPKGDEVIELRATEGFHSRLLSDVDTLFREKYWLSSDYDRMGYRLEGKPLESARHLGRLPSIPVDRGCVQIPPDGKPIVLMSDSQTMGGYAVALHALHPDVDRFAHSQPGQRVVFKRIDVDEAEEITANYLNKLGHPLF